MGAFFIEQEIVVPDQAEGVGAVFFPEPDQLVEDGLACLHELDVLAAEEMAGRAEIAPVCATQADHDVGVVIFPEKGHAHHLAGLGKDVGLFEFELGGKPEQFAHEADAVPPADVVNIDLLLQALDHGAEAADHDFGPRAAGPDFAGHALDLFKVGRDGPDPDVIVSFFELGDEAVNGGIVQDRGGNSQVVGDGVDSEGVVVDPGREHSLELGELVVEQFNFGVRSSVEVIDPEGLEDRGQQNFGAAAHRGFTIKAKPGKDKILRRLTSPGQWC